MSSPMLVPGHVAYRILAHRSSKPEPRFRPNEETVFTAQAVWSEACVYYAKGQSKKRDKLPSGLLHGDAECLLWPCGCLVLLETKLSQAEGWGQGQRSGTMESVKELLAKKRW